jgi:hypothetical protein
MVKPFINFSSNVMLIINTRVILISHIRKHATTFAYFQTTLFCSFTVKPKDASIELKPNPAILGRSFTITCNSRGFPEPGYTISHNGTRLINAKTHPVNDVMWTDAGEYECNAGNEHGNDSASDVLKVTGKILIQFLFLFYHRTKTHVEHDKRK